MHQERTHDDQSPAIDRAGYCLYALRDSMNFAVSQHTEPVCSG